MEISTQQTNLAAKKKGMIVYDLCALSSLVTRLTALDACHAELAVKQPPVRFFFYHKSKQYDFVCMC